MRMRLIAAAGLGAALLTVVGPAAVAPAGGTTPAVRTATVQGQVFADANSNKQPDRGEGLGGVTLRLENFDSQKTYRVTAGPKGRFHLVVPTGQYYLAGGTHRWKVIPKSFHVHAAGRELSLRAVRPLGKVLKADLHFTKDTYAPGDRAHVVITLTNTGSKVLRGIGAECDHAGFPDELFNRGPGWGKLAVDGPGVLLAPHTARTFDVHDRVPAAAGMFGQVELACDFGYRAIDKGYRPTADDTAKVPGEYGALAGDVGHYRDGKLIGLAHVRVVLADPDTCPVYTRRTTTDARGHFRIGHAPAGSTYQLYFDPPAGWKVRGGNRSNAFVFGDDTIHFSLEVVRGSAPVPSLPTCG